VLNNDWTLFTLPSFQNVMQLPSVFASECECENRSTISGRNLWRCDKNWDLRNRKLLAVSILIFIWRLPINSITHSTILMNLVELPTRSWCSRWTTALSIRTYQVRGSVKLIFC